MKTQTHTPGPWSADGSNIRGPDGHNVGIVSGSHTVGASDAALEARRCERERDDANARLIAAAPDMLEALKEMVDLLNATQFLTTERQRAQTIIARIEGEE